MANKRTFIDINGIVLLDKPQDISSNKALQTVRFLYTAKKAGHTGALDPLATGLLPICFGEATKFSQFLLDADKTYQVTAKLGERTTTSDSEGEVVETRDVTCDETQIRQMVESFVGLQDQQPSIYSALKYQGKPLYFYARQGIDVPRPIRQIEIFSISIDEIALPNVKMTVHCSKGTYIRTLVDDLGEKLGCGAHVIQLRRTQVTGFDGLPMFDLPSLQAMSEAELAEKLLPMDAGIQHIPVIQLTDELADRFSNGQRIKWLEGDLGTYRVYRESTNSMLGVAELEENRNLQPKRLVSQN